jgi:hypothetical protein
MATTEESKKTFVQKPEKPDQAEFEKNLQKANDEHVAVREKLVRYLLIPQYLLELAFQVQSPV